MSSGQKTALSLLISVILFGAFAVASFAGLFSVIDARFYEPSKISQIDKKLVDIAQACDDYIKTLTERFALGQAAFLKNPAVQTFVEAKPSDQDVLSRGEALGELRSSTQGFLGFRVLDKNQSSIHYSTFNSDILRRDEKNNLTAYKNYADCLSPSGSQEIPAQIVACSDSGSAAGGEKTYFDKDGRIIFSFPLYDKYSVFRGSAIFYINALDFANVLLKKNLISIGDGASFFSNGLEGASCLCGYVFGMPSVGQDDFSSALFDAWKKNSGAAERLLSLGGQSKNYWVAVSQKGKSGVFACGIYNDEIFSLPPMARVLTLICVFISIFLICFLLLNLRRDDETVIRERIRTLQLGVVDEYLSKKEALDWETISGRRDAVTKEIIQSLGGRAKKRRAQVEELINRSWDELFAAMNLKPKDNSGAMENAQEIKAMLQELLSNGALKVQAVQAPAPANAVPAAAPEPVEALEEVEDAEPVEALEEVEDAEPVEALEEVEDAEPIEALEEVEDAEPVEALEEVEDAEPVEALEEVEAVEELEDVAPLETIDESESDAPAVNASPLEAQPVEALEEVEDAEPAEAIEEVEEAEPVEALEEVEDVEPAEALEEAEEVELSDFLEDAEPAEKSATAEDDSRHKELQDLAVNLSAKDEGDIDVSENIFDDFFALRPKDQRPGAQNTKPLSSDKSLDPYSFARDSFAPNQETEDLVKNFSIVEPDFTSLDARNEEEKVNGTLEEEKKDYYKELSPEDFGVSQNDDEFAEPLEFGAPQNKDLDDGTDVASTFTTEKPSFEKRPEVFSDDFDEEIESAGEATAIPLSNSESFMFSSFGQSAKLRELQSADYNAIVQDSNGVFSIAQDAGGQEIEQDSFFKSLVDSVLNNA